MIKHWRLSGYFGDRGVQAIIIRRATVEQLADSIGESGVWIEGIKALFQTIECLFHFIESDDWFVLRFAFAQVDGRESGVFFVVHIQDAIQVCQKLLQVGVGGQGFKPARQFLVLRQNGHRVLVNGTFQFFFHSILMVNG